MNVSLPAPSHAAAGRSASPPVRPGAAGRDAGLAFEQALQARAAREQPLCESMGAGVDTEAACSDAEAIDSDAALRHNARRRREPKANGTREEHGPADAEPPPRQDPTGVPAAPGGAGPGSTVAGGTGTSGSQPRDSGATRTALAMALAMPALPVDAAAGRWEVSIPQAAGAPLELRAGRAPLADGSAGWTLDIRSRARDIHSALSRSAARLSDRLEARAICARVRIDDDEDEAP